MPENLLNMELLSLPDNVCYGCAPDNSKGLRISVYRNPEIPNRIFGEFDPGDHMVGFPGITHGGAIYTALDCMATWSGMVLRKTKAMWLLRSAKMKYHRPAFQGNPISLSAAIEKEGAEWEAIAVQAEARDSEGNLLAEGNFKVIPVPPEKFKSMTGIDNLPEGWSHWLGVSDT